jgi:hypothetical protein
MDVTEIDLETVDGIDLARDWDNWRDLENAVMNFQLP